MDYKDMYVDVDEFENQRYEAIKKSGKYIELQIIIGTEKETFNGREGKMPVVKGCMHHCGPEEVGNMYVILKQMTEYYKEKYPMECAFAELTCECNGVMDISNKISDEEE